MWLDDKILRKVRREKMENNPSPKIELSRKKTNWKMIIGVLVIAASLIYLLVSSTLNNVQYFITIDELLANRETYSDKQVRISGAVIGDSINISDDGKVVSFVIANISADHEAIAASGGMAKALQEAVNDPDATRLQVLYKGAKPDLLKDQSQAILTGNLSDTDIFYADEILLKCPTKYESAGQ